MDEGRTGRMEVTVYKNSAQSCSGEGTLVWSKATTSAFPSSDWEKFMGNVTAALE